MLVVNVSAQISIYPLRQEKLTPAVNAVREALEERRLAPDVGPMGTAVTGDSAAVFSGIQQAFEAAAAKGDTVVTVTLSNACPT